MFVCFCDWVSEEKEIDNLGDKGLMEGGKFSRRWEGIGYRV